MGWFFWVIKKKRKIKTKRPIKQGSSRDNEFERFIYFFLEGDVGKEVHVYRFVDVSGKGGGALFLSVSR